MMKVRLTAGSAAAPRPGPVRVAPPIEDGPCGPISVGGLKSAARRSDSDEMSRRSILRAERGASAVEYAVVLALVAGATIVAINNLTDTSGSYLSSTGDDIGEPREMISNMEPDLPDPPAWTN